MHSAQVHKAAVLQYAQNLGLRVHPHGADLVQEERAEISHLKQALLGRNGGGERPLDVAEERGFQQIGGHGAGVHRHKRLVPARRIGVDRLGDQLLAGPALALDQNGRAGGSHLRHQVKNAQHRLAFADNVFKVVALLQRALELDILFFRTLPGDGRANIGQKLFVVPRLLDKVLRSAIHRVDHVADRAVGGDHDDRQVRLALPDARQNFHAVLSRQRQIQQNQIIGSGIDASQPSLALGRQVHHVTFEHQQRLQRFANRCFVVDDQNAGCRFRA